MPGSNPSLTSPEGAPALFLIAGLALLGSIVRLCLKPGKTPRKSLANFGGCMAFGMMIGIGVWNLKDEWIQALFKLIVGFAAMLGPEFFEVCLVTLPRAFLSFIRILAAQIAKSNEPHEPNEPPATL